MTTRSSMRGAAAWRWLVAAAAAVFGVATIVSGGRVLFGGPPGGAILEPVVVFNFAAGFAYVVAAVGLATGRRWSTGLAVAIAAATLVVFAAVGVHVATGGEVAGRTIAALTFRSFFWALVAAASPRLLRLQRTP